MRVLGFDPPQGWAVLEIDSAGAAWIDSGSTGDIDPEEAAQEIAAHRAWQADLVCIERPSGFYPSEKMLVAGGGKLASVTSGLLVAAWVGGEVAGRCAAAALRVIPVACPAARRSIGVKIGGRPRKGQPKPPTVDQQIAKLVPLLVRGWPKRSSVDSRDAAVAALFGYQVARAEGKAT